MAAARSASLLRLWLLSALLLPSAAWAPLAAARRAATSVVLGGAVGLWGFHAEAAVVNVPRCEGGAGAGCAAQLEELEGSSDAGSKYILELLKRSEQNHERYMKEATDDYNYRNYKDFFPVTGQVLLKKSSGGFKVVTEKEYKELKKQGIVKDDMFLEN
mmetsp:Transcript_8207/g.30829  ORF Transcript_8207/g.30829 Transcript_8207/m.30829 type:complete len:159 (-) Transcript_8207:346-822(-)